MFTYGNILFYFILLLSGRQGKFFLNFYFIWRNVEILRLILKMLKFSKN